MEHEGIVGYATVPDGAVAYYEGLGWTVVAGEGPAPALAGIPVVDGAGVVVGRINVEAL